MSERRSQPSDRLKLAEFFAGIGLVGSALEPEGFKVVFANDIEASKRDLYAANFDAGAAHLNDHDKTSINNGY